MKRNLFILITFVLTVAVCLTACTTEKKVSAITVINDTLISEYEVGDTPNFSGLKAVVSYNDGSAETVTADKLGLSTVDTSTAGTKTLTITYKDFVITVDITVKEKPEVTLTGIDVVPGSVATELFIGDVLDTSGIQATANYSDGTTKALTAADLTVSEIDTTTVGDKTLTVTYEGKTSEVTVKVAGISSMIIATDALENEVKVGSTLDTSKFVATVTYSNGMNETVNASKVTFGELDTSTMGDKTLTITYRGFTLDFKVLVVGVTGITVDQGSVATSVKLGDVLDTSKITATATYNNGDESGIATKDLTVGTIDTSTAGVKALKVSYNGIETTVNITVVGVKSIVITSGTLANEVNVNGTLNTADAMATVTYTDNSTEIVAASVLTFGAVDTSTMGDKTLTITYRGFTLDFKVLVVGVTGITVDQGSVATSVKLGDVLDTSKITATATYNNGIPKVITANNLTVGTVDTAVTGTKTLAVAYTENGVTVNTSVEITVLGVKSITVVSGTLKTEILVGEVLDTSALKVEVVYQDDSRETLTADKLTLGSIDSSTAGIKKLTVTYLDKSIDVDVKVCGITGLRVDGINKVVIAGETLDLTNMKVYAVYSDSDETNTLLTAGITTNISELDFDKEGDKTLLVTYNGELGEYTVSVVISTTPPELVRLEIRVYDKIVMLGGVYDKTKITATAIYGNDTDDIITSDKLTISDISTDVAGNVTLTVSYTEGDITKEATATVKVLPISSLVVSGLASKVDFGAAYNTEAVSVTVTFSDGTDTLTKVVGIADGVTVSALNAQQAGDQTLTVSYLGSSTTVEVHVKAVSKIEIVTGTVNTLIGLGQNFDKAGLEITVTYTDGSYVTKKASELGAEISSIDTSASGNKTLTVTYSENGVTKNTTATVKVLPIASLAVSGLESKVDFGTAYNTEAVSVSVTFSDGTDTLTKVVGIADGVTVSALNAQQAGDQTLTVSYLGSSTTVKVHVKAVAKIEILAGTLDAYVRYGYGIDTSRLEVKITYTDGSIVTKKAAELGVALTATHGSTLVKPGENETRVNVVLTVSYSENSVTKSTTHTVEVLQIKGISALNGTAPTTVLIGSVYPINAVRLTVTYVDSNNNEYYYLLDKNDPFIYISNINTATTGEKALIFGFMPNGESYDYSTSVNITIKGPSAIELVDSTMQTTVNIDQEPDVANAVFKVTFTDGTYIYVDTKDINLKIDDSAINIKVKGTYPLKVTYLNIIEAEISIKVEDFSGDIDTIFGIELPDTILARKSYKNNFKIQDEPYVVGDDNPYVFYLNVLILDKNDELVDRDGKSVVTTAKVWLVNGDGSETELTGTALTDMVAIDSINNTYDFTEAAVGKTFRLEVKPAENYVGNATVSHTVTIVDAYNVYDAKELNLITNYDSDLNGEKMEGTPSQLKAVNDFLALNGIARPAGDIHGIVLHSNITIDMDDLPPEYYYTYTKNGVTKTEFYDFIYIYYRSVSVADPTFSMYGNYYSLYSYGLPCVVENGIANNNDAFSSAALFRFRYNNEDPNHPLTVDFKNDGYAVNVKNMAFRDNDPNSNDQAASERHMRGFSCIQSTMINLNLYNSNIEAFLTSLNLNGDYTYVNIDNSKLYNAWHGHVFVWNANLVAEWTDTLDAVPHANHQTNKINITNSSLTKCGGPVIMAQTDKLETNKEGYKHSGVDITADASSEIASYVTGQEAWFVAINQTPLAMQIMAMNQLVQGTAAAQGVNASYITDKKIDGVPTVNFMFVNMTSTMPGESQETYNINGSITIDGVKGLDMNDGSNPDVDGMINATGGAAPVFQSSGGGTCFTDTATGLFKGISDVDEEGNPTYIPATKGDKVYDGDYITLYFMGMGIMMEYHHE